LVCTPYKLYRSSATMEAAKQTIRERNPADVPELRAANTQKYAAQSLKKCAPLLAGVFVIDC